MTQAPVPLIVLSGRQDDVELVNRALRDGGHPVRCHWVTNLESLAQTIDAEEPQLLCFFPDSLPAPVRDIVKITQRASRGARVSCYATSSPARDPRARPPDIVCCGRVHSSCAHRPVQVERMRLPDRANSGLVAERPRAPIAYSAAIAAEMPRKSRACTAVTPVACASATTEPAVILPPAMMRMRSPARSTN